MHKWVECIKKKKKCTPSLNNNFKFIVLLFYNTTFAVRLIFFFFENSNQIEKKTKCAHLSRALDRKLNVTTINILSIHAIGIPQVLYNTPRLLRRSVWRCQNSSTFPPRGHDETESDRRRPPRPEHRERKSATWNTQKTDLETLLSLSLSSRSRVRVPRVPGA